MRTVSKDRTIGKGSTAKKVPFSLQLAETLADLEAFASFKPRKAKGFDNELPYVVYAFNYGHDLIQRSSVGNDKQAAEDRRNKTLAWVLTDLPAHGEELAKIQKEVAVKRDKGPLNEWLDDIYLNHEAAVEAHAKA